MTDISINVVRLGHVHYQHANFDRAAAFLGDFGLVEELRTRTRLYLRGYGVQPFVYVLEQSPDDKNHFLGGYWVVDSREELEKAAKLPGATAVTILDGPSGGEVVTVPDPNGNLVGFIHGQSLRVDDRTVGTLERGGSSGAQNTAVAKSRKGTFRRFSAGPSPVHKLGHYGYMVPPPKFEETLSWYTSVMNLKPTDCVFDPSIGQDQTCFMHIDLGQRYSDHHVSADPGRKESRPRLS
jgi:hypothetical protein